MTFGDILSSPVALAAFASTAFISLVPNVVLFLMPRFAAGENNNSSAWLSLGQAMAAGGLLGDVFLHTLPESKSGPETGIWILVGFTFFLTSDLIIRSLQEEMGGEYTHQPKQNPSNLDGGASRIHHTGTNCKVESEPIPTKHLNRSTIFLSIAGDALHNFSDGLAIGASYSMRHEGSRNNVTVWYLLWNHARGGLATLSILFHEVPHELGDFCTLVRAGYSTRQAIIMQLYTAVAAFCGTATAIVVSHKDWAEERLIYITAGGFLYLAGTTILPEVLSDEQLDHSNSPGRRRLFRIAQLIAFSLGIMFLYMVAVLEESEHHTVDHDHHSHQHGISDNEL